MREGDFVAVEQHGRSVVIKPKKLIDPDDVLTPEEGARLKRAEREMKQGKYVTYGLVKSPPRRSEARVTARPRRAEGHSYARR